MAVVNYRPRLACKPRMAGCGSVGNTDPRLIPYGGRDQSATFKQCGQNKDEKKPAFSVGGFRELPASDDIQNQACRPVSATYTSQPPASSTY